VNHNPRALSRTQTIVSSVVVVVVHFPNVGKEQQNITMKVQRRKFFFQSS
jgi:hypothetical protein